MSLNISEHFDKDNLHHAYLIEGRREEVVPELLKFLEDLSIVTLGNPDFCHISIDSFKIDDARNLKSLANEKSFSQGKKVFVISANSFLLEAQNSLLKMFEEPIENTHFFLVVPDVNALLKTLASRFYLIRKKGELEQISDAEKFIGMPIRNRVEFIKELLIESENEDEEGNEIFILDSTRAKALKFLNALEFVLHKKMSKLDLGINRNNMDFFQHLFKVREFLRMPGSSTKTLMESIALVIPNLSNMQSR